MKWFWENLPKNEDYSLWKAQYRFPDELSKKGERFSLSSMAVYFLTFARNF